MQNKMERNRIIFRFLFFGTLFSTLNCKPFTISKFTDFSQILAHLFHLFLRSSLIRAEILIFARNVEG